MASKKNQSNAQVEAKHKSWAMSWASAKDESKELFPITAEPIVDRTHPDNTICAPPCKKFEYFWIFSNVSTLKFARFWIFLNVFERFQIPILTPLRIWLKIVRIRSKNLPICEENLHFWLKKSPPFFAILPRINNPQPDQFGLAWSISDIHPQSTTSDNLHGLSWKSQPYFCQCTQRLIKSTLS